MKEIITFAAFSTIVTVKAQEKPNIVVFLVDDMGLMDTSVPFVTDAKGNPVSQPLNDWYRTPNMERLAKQGLRFSTFYAQSVSSPSRISIMTGQNAARHRTTNWIDGRRNNRNKYGPKDWNWFGMDSKTVTYPHLLQEAGYKTIHIGKAHFGCLKSESRDPKVVGFDVNIAGGVMGRPGSYLPENGYGHIKGSKECAVPDLEKYHRTQTFLTDALTIEALNEVRKAVKEERPFYLNMSHYAVHGPFEDDKRFLGNYQSGEFSKIKKAPSFAALIEGMDKSLGEIMDEFEKLGIAENTLIIFLGDNGGDAPLGGGDEYGSAAPFRGKKGSEYEGGVRVPFIVSWMKPDKNNELQKRFPIAQNCVQTQMATIMDIFPTIAALSGSRIPEGYDVDGSSLIKLMSGKKDKHHRDDFLMHFPHEHRGNYFTTYRKGDWKVIYYYNPETGIPSYRLYNLKNDPYEKKDVSSSEKRMLRKMCVMMSDRLKLEKAVYPQDKNGIILTPVIP